MRIATGAGVKHLRLVEHEGLEYLFEMNMGSPACADGELRMMLPLDVGMQEVTALSVGNPQCAVFVEDFNFDWRRVGAEIEGHPHFPDRTNVSFVRPVDAHTLEVRFFERGVGETMSSGTGSTGAAAAAILRGVAQSPVRVLTPAGPMDLRWDGDIYLTGPAAIVASGEYFTI
jgi:diaminopimelate epimerase